MVQLQKPTWMGVEKVYKTLQVEEKASVCETKERNCSRARPNKIFCRFAADVAVTRNKRQNKKRAEDNRVDGEGHEVQEPHAGR